MNQRWRNYGLWTSIASFGMLLMQNFGMNIVPDKYNQLVNSLFGILVVAGILNNPNSGRWYKDGEDNEK